VRRAMFAALSSRPLHHGVRGASAGALAAPRNRERRMCEAARTVFRLVSFPAGTTSQIRKIADRNVGRRDSDPRVCPVDFVPPRRL
jgi:hypothetical protein